MAISKDGISGWQRCPYPVLEPAIKPKESLSDQGTQEASVEAWDEGAVGQPCAVSMSQGRWRLYYSGRGTETGEFS
jgi:hypothetical protein